MLGFALLSIFVPLSSYAFSRSCFVVHSVRKRMQRSPPSPAVDGAPIKESLWVPPYLEDSWNFRQICCMGSVSPRAFCVADVDGDGVEEYVMGTSEGALLVLKSGHREPLIRIDFATISVVLTLQQGRDTLIIVVCLEGTLSLIPAASLAGSGSADTVGADEPSKPLLIPSNCACGAVDDTRLFLGSLDRRVHIFDVHESSPPIAVKRATVHFDAQVFTIERCSYDGRPFLIVGTTKNVVLVDVSPGNVAKLTALQHTASPDALSPSTGLLWKQSLDRRQVQHDATPTASVGRVSRLSGTDGSFGSEIPFDASPERATIESVFRGSVKVAVAALESGAESSLKLLYLAALTEDGYVWLFQLGRRADVALSAAESRRVSRTTDEDLVVLPVWQTRLSPLTPRVTLSPTPSGDPALVVVTSEGLLYMLTSRKSAVMAQLGDEFCSFALRRTSTATTAERMLPIACATLSDVCEYSVPCGAFDAGRFVVEECAIEAPEDDQAKDVYAAFAAAAGEDLDGDEVRRRVVDFCLHALTDADWDRLGALEKQPVNLDT